MRAWHSACWQKQANDAAMAQLATRQIDLALKTARDRGDAGLAAYHEAELPKAAHVSIP